jgi:hypothetical protein
MGLAELLNPRLNELGKIKIGGLGEEKTSKSGGKYRMPVKYDHFVITTLNRKPNGDLCQDEKLMKSLAEYADSDGKLRQIPVAVLSNDIEDIMQTAYVMYQGKRLAARSDGVTMERFFVDGKFLDKPISMPFKRETVEAKDAKGNSFFKLHTTFNCVIAAKGARWGGVYKFRTTSQISANQLYSSMIELLSLTNGILRGMPLRLVVSPLQVAPDGKTTTVHVVRLELVGDDMTAIQSAALERAKFELANSQQMKQTQIEYRKMLALPGYSETSEEISEIVDEFHPESAPEEAAPVDPLAEKLGVADGEIPNDPAPLDPSDAPKQRQPGEDDE